MKRKRSLARRLATWAAAIVLVAAVVAGAAAWWALSTESGARWAFERLGALMKGGLTVGAVKGPLRGPLTVSDVRWKSESLEVTVRTATLTWHLTRLLRKQVDIDSLTAEGVTVTPIPKEEKKQTELTDIHLPFNFIVRSAEVTGVVITSGLPAEPRRIDRIHLATRSAGETVRVDELTVRGPAFSFDASGDVTPLGDYPVDLNVTWSTVRAGVTYGGRGTVKGTLMRLAVVHDIERPFTAHVDSVLVTPLRTIGFDGRVTFSGLRLSDLNREWPEVTLGGEMSARGEEPERFSAEGTLHAGTALMQLGKADAAFRLARDHDDWTFERLDLTLPGRPTALSAQGTVTVKKDNARKDLPPELRLALKASWKELRWPLAGPSTVVSRAGTAALDGTLDAYDLEVDADLSGPAIPPARVSLKGSGTKERLRMASFLALVFGGRISGSGDVGWTPDVSWKLALKGEDVNPATRVAQPPTQAAEAPPTQAKQLPGSLTFTATTEGKMTKGGPVANVEVPDVRGTLRGQPFAATASLRLNRDQYLIRRLEVTSGSAHASASGEAGRSFKLAWNVSAPNIGNLVPGYAGSIEAKGRLDGPRASPRVTATVAGESLSTARQRLARLTADADVDLRRGGAIRVSAAAEGIAVGERRVDSVTLAASGTREAHQATLALVAPGREREERLELALNGGFDQALAWRGRLERLDLTSPEVGAWKLAAPAEVHYSKTASSLRGFCWQREGTGGGGGRLCAEAAVQTPAASPGGGPAPVTWTAQATIAALPLDMARPFLPPDVSVDGTVDGRVTARANAAGQLLADVDVRPSPGTLGYPVSPGGVGGRSARGAPNPPGHRASVAYRDVFLTARADPAGLTARMGATLEDVGTLSADFTLPEYNVRGRPAETQRLDGRIRADVKDLGFLQGFYQGIERVTGALHADLRLGGTRGAPTASGSIRVERAAADLPEYGLELRGIELSARAEGSDLIQVNGRITSGGGTVTLAGSSPLSPSEAAPLKLRIEGKDFVARDTAEMRVLVSPAIDIAMRGRRVDASGEVVVPQARIELKKLEGQVKLSDDFVILGSDLAPSKSPWEIHTRMRLVLLESPDPRRGVRFEGFGLKARLQGSLLAIDEPGRPTRATGELEAKDGTYKAYGQDLTLETARVFYGGGPIDNPGVDLKASRTARDGTVAGVLVRGSLERPETTVYSEPPMAQSDALAYLLLGRPLGQASQQEGSMVANAAASLGLKGGSILAKKIAGKLGLEEARIETEGSYKEANLVVGKYLSPRFYIQYGIGLFTGESTLRVSYILNKRWTLRAETSAQENGADILYTRELGRVPETPRAAASSAVATSGPGSADRKP